MLKHSEHQAVPRTTSCSARQPVHALLPAGLSAMAAAEAQVDDGTLPLDGLEAWQDRQVVVRSVTAKTIVDADDGKPRRVFEAHLALVSGSTAHQRGSDGAGFLSHAQDRWSIVFGVRALLQLHIKTKVLARAQHSWRRLRRATSQKFIAGVLLARDEAAAAAGKAPAHVHQDEQGEVGEPTPFRAQLTRNDAVNGGPSDAIPRRPSSATLTQPALLKPRAATRLRAAAHRLSEIAQQQAGSDGKAAATAPLSPRGRRPTLGFLEASISDLVHEVTPEERCIGWHRWRMPLAVASVLIAVMAVGVAWVLRVTQQATDDPFGIGVLPESPLPLLSGDGEVGALKGNLAAWGSVVLSAAAVLPAILVAKVANVFLMLSVPGRVIAVIAGAAMLIVCAILLMARSLLPAKVLLHTGSQQVRVVEAYLGDLLAQPGVLRNKDVCQFLELSRNRFSGQVDTSVKEGMVQFRRHFRWSFTMRNFRTVRCCWCCYFGCKLAWRPAWKSRWAVVRPSGVALYRAPTSADPTDVLFFDTSYYQLAGAVVSGQRHSVVVAGSNWTCELKLENDTAVRLWQAAIRTATTQQSWTREHRFGSFAAHRHENCAARWFVDAATTYLAIADAIEAAKEQVFIAGWWVSPELYLKRPPHRHPETQLSALLQRKARSGVRVFVLLYREIAATLPLDSAHTAAVLRSLHPNIVVMRHRSRFGSNSAWSHHEKIVCVDQRTSFVGGLDLAFQRFDAGEHALHDLRPELEQVWPGKDYVNQRVRDFVDVRHADVDLVDRRVAPRMPWHDVHCQLWGQAATDVARHFVERWDHARALRGDAASIPAIDLRTPSSALEVDALVTAGAATTEAAQCGVPRRVRCQVVRSAGQWSAGVRLEASIHSAYCALIDGAERFIYIENQFFCSGLDGDSENANRVADALFRRIVRAHMEGKPFRCIVVMPLLPGIEGHLVPDASASQSLLSVMYFQYRTILRGEQSLFARLKAEGVANPGQYISFFGLRTHDRMGPDGPAVTEQVYVHSKVMIVDDSTTLIGSANINDRSMLGNRDSEIAVVIEDVDTVEGTLGGRSREIGLFSRGLRMSLFREHLGLSEEECETFEDPVGDRAWGELHAIADANGEIYEEVFGVLPNDTTRSWKDIIRLRRRLQAELADDDTPRPLGSGGRSMGSSSMPSPLRTANSLMSSMSGRVRSAAGTPRRESAPVITSTRPAGHQEAPPSSDVTRSLSASEKHAHRLLDVKGHAVRFPLNFLADSSLESGSFSVAAIVPDVFN